MAANTIGNVAGGEAVYFPTGYDILVNNGVDQVALNAYITANQPNSVLVQKWVDQVTAYSQWLNAGGLGIPPVIDGTFTAPISPANFSRTQPTEVAAAIVALQTGWAEIKLLPGYVDLNGLVPGTQQILIGDMGFGAMVDPVNLMQHYVGGDLRTNENVLLTSIHALFHNSHNEVVAGIRTALAGLQEQYLNVPLDQIDPGLRSLFVSVTEAGVTTSKLNVLESELFDMSRAMVNSMYQRMVYDQYLTALVGGVPFGNFVSQDFANQPRFFSQLPAGTDLDY